MRSRLRIPSRKSPLSLVIVGGLWVLGASVFAGTPGTAAVFLPLSYLTLMVVLLTTNRRWRDWTNPLSVVIVMGFVRFGLPGLLLLSGADPDVSVFRSMRLRQADWLLGHTLALLGLLGVVVGWQIPSRWLGSIFRRAGRQANVRLSRGVRYTAVVAMLVGIIALLAFLATNASLGDIVQSGEFRRTDIQEGTGPFFWLALILISSSVVLSAYLMTIGLAWWIPLLPVAVATLLFWTLGGRVRALIPVVAALLLLWHRRERPPVSVKGAAIVVIALLPAVLLAGQLYRGGQGVEGITKAFSFDAVADYVRGAIWVDWGQLHALAGAVAIGRPGVLGGGTFWRTFLWPVSQYVIPISGKSGGVFIAETLVGFAGGKKWGFHPTLIGDAYLNFGLAGVFIATAIFGLLIKRLYLGWKEGWIDNVFYTLALLYSARIFFESVDKFSEAWVILAYAYIVMQTGRATFKSWAGLAPGHRPVSPQRPLAT